MDQDSNSPGSPETPISPADEDDGLVPGVSTEHQTPEQKEVKKTVDFSQISSLPSLMKAANILVFS